jgi:hypothetical protein
MLASAVVQSIVASYRPDREIFIPVFTGGQRSNILSVQWRTYAWLLAQPYVAGLCFIGDGSLVTNNVLLRRHYIELEPRPNDTGSSFLCSKVYTAVKLLLATPAPLLLRICADG